MGGSTIAGCHSPGLGAARSCYFSRTIIVPALPCPWGARFPQQGFACAMLVLARRCRADATKFPATGPGRYGAGGEDYGHVRVLQRDLCVRSGGAQPREAVVS